MKTLFGGALAAAALAGSSQATEPIVVYYYTQWSVWSRKFCADQMFKGDQFRGTTHVQYAFFNVDETCNLNSLEDEADNGGEGWQMPCEVSCHGQLAWPLPDRGSDQRGMIGCLKKAANARGFKLGVSLGGWTLSRNFSNCMATESSRTTLVNSITASIAKYGWDFIDFDWEYPQGGGNDGFDDKYGRVDDWDNFMIFLDALKAKTTTPLAAAVGVNPNLTLGRAPYANPTPMRKLCEKLDYVSLMTYDMMGGWDKPTGWPAGTFYDPASNYAMADELNVEWALKTWKEHCGDLFHKVVMGLPSYGKSWQGVPPGPTGDGLYQSCQTSNCLGDGSFRDSPSTVELWDIHFNYLEDSRCKHYFHDVAKQDYIYCPHQMYETGSNIWFAYDGPEAMFEKTRLARNMGAGGFMFWEPGYVTLNGPDWNEMHTAKATSTQAAIAARNHPDGNYVWREYEDACFAGWNNESIDAHRSSGIRVGEGATQPPTSPTQAPTQAPAPGTDAPAKPTFVDCDQVVSATIQGGSVGESCLASYCTATCVHFVNTSCSTDPTNECVALAHSELPPQGKVGITCIYGTI